MAWPSCLAQSPAPTSFQPILSLPKALLLVDAFTNVEHEMPAEKGGTNEFVKAGVLCVALSEHASGDHSREGRIGEVEVLAQYHGQRVVKDP